MSPKNTADLDLKIQLPQQEKPFFDKKVTESNMLTQIKKAGMKLEENQNLSVSVNDKTFSLTKEETAQAKEDLKSTLDSKMGDGMEIKEENQASEKITKTNLDYLKEQLKYTGFGEDEALHKGLEKAMLNQQEKFSLNVSKDQYSAFSNKASFQLDFSQSEKTGRVFFNRFEANLYNEKKNETRSHSFNTGSGITAKEAVNLLEGRAVKTAFPDKENPELKNEAFIKFNLKEPKNEYGNYTMQVFGKNYGVDVDKIMEKSDLIFSFDGQKERTRTSLEKGNITDVKFKFEGKEMDGKAVLNPQYKTLNLYDGQMNRLNTNKPLQGMENELSNEKNQTRQHNQSRGI